MDVVQTHVAPDKLMLESITETFMLGLLVWREARSESYAGKLAVAHSVLNRVQRPSWWGRSVLEVIKKKWQYSSLTDPHDAQLTLWPGNDMSWWECLQIAFDVLNGVVGNPAPGADSYYSDTMATPPSWADPQKLVVKIGHHLFYDLDSDHEKEVMP